MKRKRLAAFIMSLATLFLLIDFTFLNDYFESFGTRNNDETVDVQIVETLNEIPSVFTEAAIEIPVEEPVVQEPVGEPAVIRKKKNELILPVAVDYDLAATSDSVIQIEKEPETVIGVLADEGACVITYAGKELTITEQDFKILCRIVEAEASIEDTLGKQLVANVVLNRVVSPRFPDSVEGVVFDNGAFSSINNGRYASVDVEESTVSAVQDVLEGADESMGAVYFLNKKTARTKYINMFEKEFIHLFHHSHHDFYKEK